MRKGRVAVCALVLGVAVLVGGSALTACGGAAGAGGKTAGEPAAAKPAAGLVVEMNDQNTYAPPTLSVKKGTTVTWKNGGTMPHNIVSDATIAIDKTHARVPSGVKPFISPMLMGGGTWSYTFDVPGEYGYFCQPHEALGMVARITVTD
jgi:plastocyanin